MDEDFQLAVQLQRQFDDEYEVSLSSLENSDSGGVGKKNNGGGGGGGHVTQHWKPPASVERPLSIVDESWEILDPSPDVRTMFMEFNDRFFWGKLCGVEVKWSPRMTLCAGVCSYEGRGGLCSIRLSEPLLKLRPRKDLVETLLHEMIHALLFVTQNNRDRDGHGPEFCKHMNRINKASGTKITIYHSFHDEVDVYRQHWWRCNGPCQQRRPYFGFVKRAMNRAPSSLDPWWEDHRRSCGGTYTKVKEPEGYGQKGKKNGKKAIGSNIPSTSTSTSLNKPTASGSGSQDIRNVIPFSGKGFLLGGSSQTPTSQTKSSPSSQTFLPTSTRSPKKLLPPASLLHTVSSPARSGLFDQTQRFTNTSTSQVQKPPVKTSVGNSRAFLNVNGSPVKIPKWTNGRKSQIASVSKQKSIQELFNTSFSEEFDSRTEKVEKATGRDTSVPAGDSRSSAGSKGGAPRPLVTSTSTGTSSAGVGGSQPSRKRSWDDRHSTASIFEFFQKTSSSNSAASTEPAGGKLAAVQQGGSSSSSTLTSTGLSSSSSSSSIPSATTLPIMVNCPVCQAKIQESKINEHLDSCLS